MSSAYPQPTGLTPPHATVQQQPTYPVYTQPTADGRQMVYVRTPDGVVREPYPVPASSASALGSWLDYSNSSYLKGLLIGAGATLLVTSPAVQSAVVKGAVATWTAVVGGIEEIKERVRDAKAEKSMT